MYIKENDSTFCIFNEISTFVGIFMHLYKIYAKAYAHIQLHVTMTVVISYFWKHNKKKS